MNLAAAKSTSVSQVPAFPGDVVVLGYRTSKSLWTFTVLGSVMLLACIGMALYSHQTIRDTFGPPAILAALLGLIHLQQRGYRVAWNSDALYVRRWGIWNELNFRPQITRVPWGAVQGVGLCTEYIFGRRADDDYRPDEWIEVRFGRKEDQRVRVYPYMIDMADFEEFARLVEDRFNLTSD